MSGTNTRRRMDRRRSDASCRAVFPGLVLVQSDCPSPRCGCQGGPRRLAIGPGLAGSPTGARGRGDK